MDKILWHDRPLQGLQVGSFYYRRDGVIGKCIETCTGDFQGLFIIEQNISPFDGYKSLQVVTEKGGFGDYPNHRDFVAIVAKDKWKECQSILDQKPLCQF